MAVFNDREYLTITGNVLVQSAFIPTNLAETKTTLLLAIAKIVRGRR